LLGDGNLTYGHEKIVEAFYTAHLWRGFFASFDVQHVNNPGYNKDRGPVTVPGLRLHVNFKTAEPHCHRRVTCARKLSYGTPPLGSLSSAPAAWGKESQSGAPPEDLRDQIRIPRSRSFSFRFCNRAPARAGTIENSGASSRS